MTSHRTITLAGVILVALALAVPVSASANSLLSGYGGPGQGNQAILGSALLNGPSGGGGGGSTGAGSSATSAGVGGSGATGSAGGSGAGRSPSRRNPAPRHGAPRVVAISGASENGGPAYQGYLRAGAAGGSSETLGLSGSDLLFILLALAALLFTAFLTRGLARTTATRRHG